MIRKNFRSSRAGQLIRLEHTGVEVGEDVGGRQGGAGARVGGGAVLSRAGGRTRDTEARVVTGLVVVNQDAVVAQDLAALQVWLRGPLVADARIC